MSQYTPADFESIGATTTGISRRGVLSLLGTMLGGSTVDVERRTSTEVSDDARSRVAFEHVKPAYNQLVLADGDADEALDELKGAVRELEEEMNS